MKRTAVLLQKGASSKSLKEAFVDLTGKDFSFWPALVWRFHHSNHAQRVISFGWKFSLPGGGMSTDPQHEVLLESFRTMVWGMLTNDEYGKSLSVGTLPRMSGGIREAFRWFVWNAIGDFSQLSEKFLETYLDTLAQLIVDKEEVYPGFVAEGYRIGYHSPSLHLVEDGEGEEDEDGVEEALAGEDAGDEDDGASHAQVASRVAVFYYIHAQCKLLKKRKLPVLPFKPFKGKTFSDVSSNISPHVINRIPALPQAVSLPLLTELLRWIDDVGPQVKNAHLSFHLAREDGENALGAIFAELDAAGLSANSMALKPWRERAEDRNESVAEHVSYRHHRMRLATMLYRDACVLVLQYLAGLRISEVCSAMVARDKLDGLPSCLYKRVSPDGMMDLYFLKATMVKGRKLPTSKAWVIGCVPCGSERLPVLVRALDQLHDVISPFFTDDKEMSLFLHYSNRWGMPRNENSVVHASGIDLNRGCRRFIRCFVDLSKLPDYDGFGNSLLRYRESRGGCIRTHQGRKTFADYCLKTRKSSLSALSFHYGHLTETITYKGYYEPIQRLADEVESMAHSATVDFFVSRSERKAVFGNMAEAVDRFFEENKLDSIEDIRVLRMKVKDIVLAHDIRIYFNDFGNCFVSVAPMESRCQQAAGGASWMLRKPNYMTRNITMCGGCNCFLLDATHRPHWERRLDTWREAAKDPTNRVAVRCFEQSQVVVRLFDKKL